MITDEQLEEAVKNSVSFAGVLRHLGIRPAGGSQSHYKRRVDRAGIDYSHFTGKGWNVGNTAPTRKDKKDILVLREDGHRQKTHQLKRALIESGIEHKCNICGQVPEWRGNPLTLDVDHINENWLDDRIENLRFLCPNCHSQLSRKLIK